MNVFVINSGSSSIKYQLIRMPQAEVVCAGIVDRIGLEGSAIQHKTFSGQNEHVRKVGIHIPDHASGLTEVARLLTDSQIGVIQDPMEIDVVGHRVVHGGEDFSDTIIISEAVKEKIKNLFPLAPLHNPPNYLGIEVAEQIFKHAKQVAVFDTAFHQTMPPVAYRMAIPNLFYDDHGIRAYGFHGTSHKYVSETAAQYLQKNGSRIITIHLGNGCSMSAVQNGTCIDTSMGLGPMNGLIMGTRTGDIDQSVIFHMVNQLGYSLDDVNDILNKKSGMLGLTGFSDMRDVKAAYEKGNEAAVLAYEMYCYHIRKYIGSFAAVLSGIDAIVFTAGVGENDPLVRSLSTSKMAHLGIYLDEKKNKAGGKGIYEINTSDSPVKILIVPTNEELEIARQCYMLLNG
ncbi:MAG: acetate kinase [Cyclobacteriaceae bacterium]|nr:acetate kinase [Cyclobacteriaceae bacterium]MDH4298644.1 acetate kinase [Cyclobacteriaceae bacterium]MDH5250199.1 acetate kinase [Cyclobacteriaceae bacterium]